jgi:hypothetical protein
MLILNAEYTKKEIELAIMDLDHAYHKMVGNSGTHDFICFAVEHGETKAIIQSHVHKIGNDRNASLAGALSSIGITRKGTTRFTKSFIALRNAWHIALIEKLKYILKHGGKGEQFNSALYLDR